ncbi:MAG: DUF373 family protein [Candidatus Micrarchaeota archaeon]
MATKRVLVICVDRDNDLHEKAKVRTPVIGREENITAATRLALIDPEETDANTIFEAVRVFDEVSKESEAQIATLGGDKKLGYRADKEIAEQIDKVLAEFKADSCIFVSDGASDEQVMPIIQSRLRIDYVKIVVMKQAKELEKTYFVLLEKLKEPHYARMVFGLPGLLLFLLVLGYWIGLDWRPMVAILGLYLLAKGFGIEDRILHAASDFRVSVDKIGFIVYLSALPLGVISLWLGLQEYITASQTLYDPVKIAASVTRSILILLPWAGILVVLGKMIELLNEKRRLEALRHSLYGVSVVVVWFILKVTCDWVLRDAYFSDLAIAIIGSIIFAFLALEAVKRARMGIALSMKLENKEVLNDVGAYIGKIVSVDRRHGVIIVQTSFGQKLNLGLESVMSVSDRVMVKY